MKPGLLLANAALLLLAGPAAAAPWHDVATSISVDEIQDGARKLLDKTPCRQALVPSQSAGGAQVRYPTLNDSEHWKFGAAARDGESIMGSASARTSLYEDMDRNEAMNRILETGLLVNQAHDFEAMADLYEGIVTPEQCTAPQTYERGDRLWSRGARSQVFENFQSTRAWAATDRQRPSLQNIIETNARITNRLGFPHEQGVLRDHGSVGCSNETVEPAESRAAGSCGEQDQLDLPQLAALYSTGYCTFRTQLPREATRRRLLAGKKIPGQIVHPSIDDLTPLARGILQRRDAKLYARVRRYESGHITKAETMAELNRAVITVLAEDAIEKFKMETGGYWSDPVRTPRMSNVDAATHVSAVVHLYRSLLAIHPFTDANGRSLRVGVLYRLLEAVGLPAPRLANLDEDILLSKEDLLTRVIDGITHAHDLKQDIATRVALGLPWQRSPLLLFPGLPRILAVQFGDGIANKIPLNRADFARWFEQSPPKGWRRGGWPLVVKAYMAHLATNVWMPHNYPGYPERWEQSESWALADESAFSPSLLASHHADPATHRALLTRYYRSNMVFRGLMYEGRFSDREMLKFFSELTDHTVSNRLGGAMSASNVPLDATNPRFQRLLLREIRDHNRRLLTADPSTVGGPLPGRFRMVRDHVTGNNRSDYSPWSSSSDQPNQATIFTFAVSEGIKKTIAEVGNRGVLLGFMMPQWALGTHSMSARHAFKAIEHEQLVPGIIHPDAVYFAATVSLPTATRDAYGGYMARIEKLYVRNPDDPVEIAVYKNPGLNDAEFLDLVMTQLSRVKLSHRLRWDAVTTSPAAILRLP